MVGTRIDHYDILERLGQGGMGVVYRALDVNLEREVALKLLRPEYAADPQFAERFRAEAMTLAKLSHRNIATLLSFVREGAQLCMVMELARGETLANLMKQAGPFPWERAVFLAGQMLEALQYAHDRHVVHRDIKPSNLMVGEDDHLKLMDFGIARLMGSARVTQMGLSVGTLEYIAPEQIRGEDVDGRADIYATGVVLYEMVTGQLPFKSSRATALMYAHMQQEVVPPRMYRPNLPWYLSDVIVRALSKAPSDRFATARELYDALGASPSAGTTVAIRVPNGYTKHDDGSDNNDNAIDGDDSTRTVAPPDLPQPGWFARWWPQVRLSSKRFGGAQDAAVMYQAAVGAGGFGGAIRIVAVRMGSAGREAANRMTHAFLGASHLLARRPLIIMLTAMVLGLGGWWWWQQRHATAAEPRTSSEQALLDGHAAPATPAPSASLVSAPAPAPARAPALALAPAPPVEDSDSDSHSRAPARVATSDQPPPVPRAPLTSLPPSRSAPQPAVSAATPAGSAAATPVMSPMTSATPPAAATATAPAPASTTSAPIATLPPAPLVSAAPPAPAPVATSTAWSKTFDFPVFRGTRLLHVAPDRIRYEMRDTDGRVADDGFTASCADIAEWTAGRFKGSLHVQLKAGRKLDFTVSGQKLTEILDSYAEACGH
jgi:hypothetical protein